MLIPASELIPCMLLRESYPNGSYNGITDLINPSSVKDHINVKLVLCWLVALKDCKLREVVKCG